MWGYGTTLVKPSLPKSYTKHFFIILVIEKYLQSNIQGLPRFIKFTVNNYINAQSPAYKNNKTIPKNYPTVSHSRNPYPVLPLLLDIYIKL